jgi:hypothetical protein
VDSTGFATELWTMLCGSHVEPPTLGFSHSLPEIHGGFKIVKAAWESSRYGMSRCGLVWRVAVEMGTKLRYDMGLPADPRYSWSFVAVQSAT